MVPMVLSRFAPVFQQSAVMRDATASDVSAVTVQSGSANTKGSWSQIIASTSIETDGITLFLNNDTFVSGQDAEALVDIGIGSAASEQTVVANLRLGRRDINTQERPQVYLPMRIPSGSRIACRAQSVLSTRDFDIGIDLYGGSRWGQQRGFAQCATVGADTADSGGVALATPAGTNTEGAWTEITSSTPTHARALLLMAGCTGDTALAADPVLFDVAVGAASSEQAILSDIQWFTGTSEVYYSYLPAAAYVPVSCDIPAGSRLAVRYQSSTLSNDFDVVLYLFS